jgi:hypothetical protein
MYEDYPGAAEDAVELFYSVFFWKEWKLKPGDKENARAGAERKAIAKMYSLVHTGNLRSTLEDALLIQLHNAQTENWMADIGEGIPEIATMTELISIALDREIEKRPSGGMRWEYARFLRMLNALEKIALDAERKGGAIGEKAKKRVQKQIKIMITTPKIASKIRESGGAVEHILDSDADDVKKIELVHEVFEEITDPDVSVLEFRENNRERMGKAKKTVLSPIPGDLYLLGDREIIVIESRGPGYTRAVENKLRGLVTDLMPRDGVQMLKRVTALIDFKATHTRYAMKNGELIEDPDGIKLPTPEAANRLCQDSVLRSREIIDQFIDISTEPIYVPIETITRGLTPQDLTTFVCNAFRVENGLSNVTAITQAIAVHYDVPPDVRMLQFLPYAVPVVW